MARRAAWWLRLVRAGRVERFHADLTGLERRRVRPGPRDRALLAFGHALRQEWRARVEAGPAGPALARADHPNYLGSRAVVRGLIDGYFALLIARAGGRVPFDACVAEMRRLAHIFAGAAPAFPPIGGWNTSGQLGEAAIRWVPLAEDVAASSLERVLQETFAAVGLGVLRILRAAEQSDLETDAALARLSELAEVTAGVMLGEAGGKTLEALQAGLPD